MRGAAISVAAMAAPGWLRRAFADTTVKPCEAGSKPTLSTGGHGESDFGEALKRARASGRPLLAIVVPEKFEERYPREALIGGWLLSSPDDALAPLALADVVCARPSVMSKHGLRLPEGDLVFVVVAPHGERAATMASVKDQHGYLSRMIAQLIPTGALAPDLRATLARKAARLRKDRIPGSAWTYTVGCGMREPRDAQPGDEASSIGCGMGSTGPSYSQRFLRFYVNSRQG